MINHNGIFNILAPIIHDESNRASKLLNVTHLHRVRALTASDDDKLVSYLFLRYKPAKLRLVEWLATIIVTLGWIEDTAYE